MIFLTGANGQVGHELRHTLAPLGPVVATTRAELDLKDEEAIRAAVRAASPRVIVNAAAYTAVVAAESDVAACTWLNVDVPRILAEEADRCGAWLVHYSTDYVFDGSGTTPWRETDATGPLGVYGQTKREGELAVARWSRHLIFRTSWVYAARGGNFARTMLRLAQERETLSVVDDQIGAPTGAELLADITAHALCRVQSHPDLAGLYHLAAAGETSWHGYARHVIDYARQQGAPIKVAPDAVLPIPTSAYPLPAPRPLNSRLDTTRLQAAFGVVLPDWRCGVERMLDEILGGNVI